MCKHSGCPVSRAVPRDMLTDRQAANYCADWFLYNVREKLTVLQIFTLSKAGTAVMGESQYTRTAGSLESSFFGESARGSLEQKLHRLGSINNSHRL